MALGSSLVGYGMYRWGWSFADFGMVLLVAGTVFEEEEPSSELEFALLDCGIEVGTVFWQWPFADLGVVGPVEVTAFGGGCFGPAAGA